MTAALAFVLWILDQHFCVHLHGLSSGNPQFHAWWHILMGINGYLGPTFLSYQRECHLGKRKPRWVNPDKPVGEMERKQEQLGRLGGFSV